MFIFIGGEAQANPIDMLSGFWVDQAKIFVIETPQFKSRLSLF